MDNLTALESTIMDAFRENEYVLAVSFDLMKAYDTTWRRNIINKLLSYGLKGNLMKFVTNFLTKRYSITVMGNLKSKELEQETGLVQGSVISVTLFLVAANEFLSNNDHNVGKLMYADDLTLYMKGKNLKNLGDEMQNVINTMSKIAKSLGFKFSPEKTVAMIFSRKHKAGKEPKLKFEGKNLSFVQEHRILGIIFDRKLNWGSHIKDIKSRASKRMNILRMLCNPKYGVKRHHLLILHQSIILSVFDYGSMIYDSASDSKLKSLDSINMKAVRIATGAFKTSPNENVLVESGMLPLTLRRELQTLKYAINILSFENHVGYEELLSWIEDEDLLIRQKRNVTLFYERAAKALMEHKIVTKNLICNKFQRSPPWKDISIHVELTLSSNCKNEMTRQTFKQIAMDRINMYQDHEVVYTDGSKTESAVGWDYCTSTETRNGRLQNLSSVFSAELHAIYKAVKWCNKSKKVKFLICSDSLSALTSIQNIYPRNSLVQKVKEEFSKNKRSFSFLWVPGHVGIPGNGEADESACKGARKALDPSEKTYENDFKSMIKAKIWLKWKKMLETIESSS
jgi:ribonuclease HI